MIEDVRGQHVNVDGGHPLRHMHHPFYDVFKLTDVAGPRVTEEHIHSPIRNPQGAAPEGGDEVIEEMVDQKRDVRTAFAQGGTLRVKTFKR